MMSKVGKMGQMDSDATVFRTTRRKGGLADSSGPVIEAMTITVKGWQV
jgi:hypothetical protein